MDTHDDRRINLIKMYFIMMSGVGSEVNASFDISCGRLLFLPLDKPAVVRGLWTMVFGGLRWVLVHFLLFLADPYKLR